jgi:hypothetical protein
MTSISSTILATPRIASTTSANWLAEAYTQIQVSMKPDGMLGALQNAKNPGSLHSFLRNSLANSDALALISQGSADTAASVTMQIAAATYQRQLQERLDAERKLEGTKFVPPQRLDPVIYFENGSWLDTVNNIMTLSNGIQIDTTTGLEVIDPSSIIQLANGAYLDTKKNILTMPDGTRIDTVTGLVITV